MIFVGIDWAEAHHDVCVLDDEGAVLAKGRVPDGVEGVAPAARPGRRARREPGRGGRRDRDRPGPAGRRRWSAAGYAVYAVNPLRRHPLPGSPRDIRRQVRSRRRQGAGRPGAHRPPQPPAGRRRLASWPRRSRCSRGPTRASSGPASARSTQLRSALREYYPGALSAFGPTSASADALAVLAIAPDARARAALSAAEDRRRPCGGSGRERNLERGRPRSRRPCGRRSSRPRRSWPRPSAHASRSRVARASRRSTHQIDAARATSSASAFERHPDAEILRSLPGLGLVLGARVLGGVRG